MLRSEAPSPAVSNAAEMSGNSTLIMLLLDHLHRRGMIDAPELALMIQRAEANTVRDAPQLAGSAVIGHTLAWLQAQDG